MLLIEIRVEIKTDGKPIIFLTQEGCMQSITGYFLLL